MNDVEPHSLRERQPLESSCPPKIRVSFVDRLLKRTLIPCSGIVTLFQACKPAENCNSPGNNLFMALTSLNGSISMYYTYSCIRVYRMDFNCFRDDSVLSPLMSTMMAPKMLCAQGLAAQLPSILCLELAEFAFFFFPLTFC